MTFASRRRQSRASLFDKSIKQGGRESPCLSNLMMKSVFRSIQKDWEEQQLGVNIRRSEEENESHDLSRQLLPLCRNKKSDAEDDQRCHWRSGLERGRDGHDQKSRIGLVSIDPG